MGQYFAVRYKYRERGNKLMKQIIKNSERIDKTEVITMQATKTYYKVIVLRIDAFESEIVDERHFPNVTEAMSFCDNVNNTSDYTTFTVRM